MLEFTCPSCARRLSVDDAAAGKKCRCGGCGQVVDAPRPAAVRASAPPPSRPPDPPRPPAAPEAPEDSHTIPPSVRGTNGAGLLPPAAIPLADDSALCDFLAPPQAPDEIGRLGGYRVLEVLGGGGMGVVFLAEDVRLQRRVALKTLLPALAASPANRQRFHQEAQAAAAIEHDHVVTIYQVGEDRGVPFIAMQLLRGESLDARLRRLGRLEPAEVVRIGREIASGLAFAHDKGLIHRDVKPSNIWLEAADEITPARGGRVKLLDFGLARLLTSESHLTRSGAILGTPAYMSPEQARGRPVDPRTDLFSLGCVLYQAGTGRPPFKGADVISTLMAVAEDDPTPPSRLDPRVPAPLSGVIMALLAKDPARRPQSARDVVRLLGGPAPDADPDRTEPGTMALPPALALGPAASTGDFGRRSGSNSRTLVQADGPAAGDSPKWLLIAGLVAGAGVMALVLVLGLVAYLVWGRGPSRPNPTDAAKSAPRPDAPPALGPELQALLRDDLLKLNYTRTNIVGFPFAPEFTEVAPEGGVLVGFEFGIGRWEPNDVIHSIRPIFLNDKGEFFGKVRGKPTERIVTVKAKKGYAVGAVRLDTHLLIDGMDIAFMKIDRKRLDPEQVYWEKAGTIAEKAGTKLGGDGSLVLGICGKDDGRTCNAFGLVLRGKTDK